VGIAFLTAIICAEAAPAMAAGAKVDSFVGGRGDETFRFVEYDSAAGETNQVRASVAFGGAQDVATIDDVVPIIPGAGCIQPSVADPTVVQCVLGRTAEPSNTAPQAFDLNLGDGNDTAVIAPNARVAARIDGGPGNDVLTGGIGGGTLDDDTPGPDGNFLRGGLGNDVLKGGELDDTFFESGTGVNGRDSFDGGGGFDAVDYEGRRAGVKADLQGDRDDGAPGEGDRIGRNIENLYGGRGADRLAGGAGPNVLRGREGRDKLNGGAGPDELSVGRGTTGDTVSAGAGDDEISGNAGPNSISAGRGEDIIRSGGGADRIRTRDRSSDQLSCGRGRDRVRVDALDYVARGCDRVVRRGEPRVVLVSDEALTGGRAALLNLGCPVDFVNRCRVSISIRIRGTLVGKRRLSLARGRTDEREVRLNRVGRRIINRRDHTRARVRIKTRLPDGRAAFVVQSVTLFR
jgi:Ca2+-binding RTX toxin-like protein